MEWIRLLLLLCCGGYCVSEIDNIKQEHIEEGINLKLGCPTPKPGYNWRAWNYGFKEDVTDFVGDEIIYRQMANSNIVITNLKERMKVDKDSADFTIDNIKLEDKFNFTCRFQFPDGVGGSQKIDVTRAEISPYVQPVVNITRSDEDKFEEDVTVTCTVHRLFPTIAQDQFKMEWEGQRIKPAFEEHDITGDQYAKKYTLSVTHKLEKGTQTITCTVTPEAGFGQPASSKKLEIDVQYKPQKPPDASVDYPNPYTRDTVIFTCSPGEIDANPAVSKVKWMNGPSEVSTGYVYTIDNVDVSHSGTYGCAVGNSVGFSDPKEVVLTVSPYYPPYGTVAFKSDKEEPIRNTPVVFTCDIENVNANPNITSVTWTRDNILQNWPNDTVHYIKKITEGDSGMYSCAAGNGIRESLVSADVVFTVSPYFKPIGKPSFTVDDETPMEGDTVKFNCDTSTIDANPKVIVKWLRDGGLPDGWPSDGIFERKMEASDNGSYTCIGNNRQGDSTPSDPKTIAVRANPNGGGDGDGEGGGSSIVMIIGIVVGVLAAATIAAIIFVVIRRKSSKPKNQGNNSNPAGMDLRDNSMGPVSSNNYGNDNEVEYSEIGAAGRGNPTPTPRKTLQSDLLHGSNSNLNQSVYPPDYGLHTKEISEYEEVRKPPISKKPPVAAPPGTEGMIYAEGLWDGESSRPVKTRQAPPKPAPAPKKQVEEPTEYAQIDYTKSAYYNTKSAHV